MIRRKTESENRDFDTFIRSLMSILNSTFSDKGKWYLSEDRFERAVIEHEGGVKFTFRDFRTYCPPSVPCNNPWDLSISVTFPNGRTQHIDHYLKERDVIDIADKMYELAVVKYRNEGRVRTESSHYWLDRFSKHEGLKEIIDSCTDKEKEELNTAITEIMNAANDLKEGHSLSAFLDCLLAGNNMTKLANKLKRKQVWYRWH